MGDKGKHQHKESNSKSIRTNAIHLSAYCVPVTQLNVNNHHSHLWWAQFSRDVQLVNKNNVTRCEKCRNKYVQRHRGDGIFLKRFLKRNQGRFPGGPKRQKSNLSRAEQEPQVVWQCWSKVSLEVNRDGDEGDGAGELLPCQTPAGHYSQLCQPCLGGLQTLLTETASDVKTNPWNLVSTMPTSAT